MPIQINTDMSAVAYHIVDGPITFQYAIDATHAVSSHPNEWSATPWSADEADAARIRLKADGKPISDPEPLSPEDQAELDAYNAAVAAAAERLGAYQRKQAAAKAEAEQAAADERLVASPPPRPDPTARRPFGRKGELTPAELRQMEKQTAKKADDERVAKEKAEADKGAGVQIAG